MEKKWKPIALLSIIVPLSLLLAVRFAGVAPEAYQAETIELETAAWNTQRPGVTIWPEKLVQNLYDDGQISLNFSLYVWEYTENRGIPPYEGLDVIEQDICVNASVKKGFVVSVNIRFSQVEDNAYLDIIEDKVGFFVEERNVEITSWKDSRLTQYPSVEARAVGQPKDCYLLVTAFWTFMDNRNDRSHSIIATSETTYFNGTAYKKIVAPIKIGMQAYDNNDSLETAQEVALDSSYDWLFLGGKDKEDNYKIWLNQGQQLDVVLYPPSQLGASADFDLYLIDKDENMHANSTNREDGAVEEATVLSSYDGWWYIKVVRVSDCGYYSIVTKAKT